MAEYRLSMTRREDSRLARVLKIDIGEKMTKKEVNKIMRILLKCDRGCEYCVSDLLKLFCENFPEHKGIAEKTFKESFGKELWNVTKKLH